MTTKVLSEKQLLDAYENLEVTTDRSSDISVAESSRASIYKPVQERLKKIYGMSKAEL